MIRWLPVPTAVAYIATVVAMFPRLVHALFWDTDASAALVLAERLRGDGPVSIPHFGFWTSQWWLLATRGLPGHVQLWEATGYAFAVAGALVVGWATARVAGRWAGATAAAGAIVVGPIALRALLTVNFHVSTPFTAVVLAAYLAVLARRRSQALAVAVGLLAGVNAASDPLLWIAGILPFAVGGAVLATRTSRRDVGVRAATTVGVGVASALATNVLMHGLGFHIVSAEIRPGELGDVASNIGKLGRLAALVGGANYALPGGYPREPLRALLALLVLGGIAAAIFSALRHLVRRAEPTKAAYACYWATAIVLLGVTFVATSQGTKVGGGGFLYLLTLAPATAAGVAVLASGSRRGEVAIALAVTAIGCANIAGVIDGHAGTPVGAIRTYKEPLVRVLEKRGVTRGYAGFWDAQNLTWQSGLRVLVAPVTGCGHGRDLCRFEFFTIDSWYRERPGPSFLLVDPETAFLAKPPRFVAGASASYRFGPLTLYLFPYDLARRVRQPDEPRTASSSAFAR